MAVIHIDDVEDDITSIEEEDFDVSITENVEVFSITDIFKENLNDVGA